MGKHSARIDIGDHVHDAPEGGTVDRHDYRALRQMPLGEGMVARKQGRSAALSNQPASVGRPSRQRQIV